MTLPKILRYILLAAAVFMMALIFYFSSQDDVESSKTSGDVTEFVLETVVPAYKKMTGARRISFRKAAEHLIRKLAHFSEFALLSCAGQTAACLPRCWPAGEQPRCTPAATSFTRCSYRAAVPPPWMWALTAAARCWARRWSLAPPRWRKDGTRKYSLAIPFYLNS